LSVPINKLAADVGIYAESVWMEHDASGGPPDRDFLSMVQEFVDDPGGTVWRLELLPCVLSAEQKSHGVGVCPLGILKVHEMPKTNVRPCGRALAEYSS
jgi:hypothetical protein